MKTTFLNQIATLLVLLVSYGVNAQNVFLDRAYWKTNPSLEEVQQKVKEGNDPTQFNSNAFDAGVYSILSDVNLEAIKYIIEQQGNGVEKITHDGRTYLFWAAYRGNIPLVKYLLEGGSKINALDDHGFTPMNFAANAGQTDKALYDLLIEYGADVKNEKDLDGANVMLLMVPYLKDLEMVDYFESKGLSVTTTDNLGNSAFNYAARTGNIEMMDLLIGRGVEYKGLNKEGGNAMLFAAMGTRSVTNPLSVYQYLEKKGVEPNVLTTSGTTPLHILAARSNDLDVLRYFDKKKVDANQTDAEGNNPLMIAAFRNEFAVVQFFVAETKDINTANKKGETALNRAVAGNTTEVVNYLISEDANINEMTGRALIASYRKGNEKELDAKLAAIYADDFNPSAVQEAGNTLLHYAVEYDDAQLVTMVLNWEMDINAKNDEGYTALHIAAMKASSPEVLKLLVNKGADVSAKTEFEESAFDLASENELLAKNGADLGFLKS